MTYTSPVARPNTARRLRELELNIEVIMQARWSHSQLRIRAFHCLPCGHEYCTQSSYAHDICVGFKICVHS